MNSSDDENEMIVLPVKKYSNEEIENEVDEDVKMEVKMEEEDVEDDVALLKCDVCGKDVNGQSELEKHLKTHKQDKRNFVCNVCGKSCLGQKSLLDHERSHKKVSCDKCDKEYSPKNIYAHKKTCKGKKDPSSKRKVCEECGYSTEKGHFQKFYFLA